MRGRARWKSFFCFVVAFCQPPLVFCQPQGVVARARDAWERGAATRSQCGREWRCARMLEARLREVQEILLCILDVVDPLKEILPIVRGQSLR